LRQYAAGYGEDVKLSDLGEFGLIDKLRERVAATALASDPEGGVLVGIGDDAAVTRTRSGDAIVSTTDALVERVHFRLDWSSAADVGFKAASVNVSDLAAMGAEPRWLLVALCAPPDVSDDVVEGIYDGLNEAGALYRTQVIGGDTVRAKELVIAITSLGELDGEPMLRSSATPGDALAVTGPLGRAAAGVNLLLSQDPKRVIPEHAPSHEGTCIDAHRRPVARVSEGRKLAAAGVRTAMDVSDGLASDARRLADASGIALELDVERLPIAIEAASVAEDRGWDVRQMVLGGGEDLELLVAAPAELVEELGLIVIGRVTNGAGVWLVEASGDRGELGSQGWDHFRGTG
jgi:thiamine-monophosphate kinase